jgi:hypothetical protein
MPQSMLGHISRKNNFNNVDVYRAHKNVIKLEKNPKIMIKASKKWIPKRKPRLIPTYQESIKYVVLKHVQYPHQRFDPILHGPRAAPKELITIQKMEDWCKYKLRLGKYELDPKLSLYQITRVWWQTGLDFNKRIHEKEAYLLRIRLQSSFTNVRRMFCLREDVYVKDFDCVVSYIPITKNWTVLWKVGRPDLYPRLARKWSISYFPHEIARPTKIWMGKKLVKLW